jgi:hypothetical protein
MEPVQRLETGIYVLALQGWVRLREIYAQQAAVTQMIQQANGDQEYVFIITMTPATRIQFDLSMLTNLFAGDASLCLIIVGVSKSQRILAQTVLQLFPNVKLRFAETLEIAIQWGREILATAKEKFS